VVGQLTDINMDAKTLCPYRFASCSSHREARLVLSPKGSESNEEIDCLSISHRYNRGVRNLRGQEGKNATIRYVESDNRKSAVQIHIEVGS